MLRLKDGGCCKMPLGAICVLVFQYTVVLLHLTPFCEGQSQVVGPSESILTIAGDDTVLPCHLDPAVNAADMTIEWTRADLTPRFVYVWRDGVDLENKKHPAYKGRTSVAINKLKLGDISLKLSKVKLSDRGSYRCFVPALNGQASIDLYVGAVSSLLISLMRNNKDSSKVELQCESAGWYPEPELLWLDGEGNLLPAGPTETLRGPDDLYSVSSRVTVEKKHSNNFTCRVQQKNISQSRETHIHVPDDFFNTSCSSAVRIIIVCTAVMVLVLAVFVVWIYHCKRQGNNFTGTSRDHTELQLLTENKNETQCVTEESVDISDEEQQKLEAEFEEQEQNKWNLIIVVNSLMTQKADLENDIHKLKLELEKMKLEDENQSQLGTNVKPTDQTDMQTEEVNDKEDLKIKTNMETRKKAIEKEIEKRKKKIKSVLYGVELMTEKKKDLDDALKEIYEKLEKIKQTKEVQLQCESGVSEA